MSAYIGFRSIGKSPSGKTERWTAHTVPESITLGIVGWFAPWRKYAFMPTEKTVFEEDCLRSIARFCEERTADHRLKGKA
jgi:hypothetical protein